MNEGNKSTRQNVNVKESKKDVEGGSATKKKAWNVDNDIVNAIKRTSNKYSVLDMYDENDQGELSDMRNKEIVDIFLSLNQTPTDDDMEKWDMNMIAYYNKRKELLVDKGKKVVGSTKAKVTEQEDVFEDLDKENVCRNKNGMSSRMAENIVKEKEVLNNENIMRVPDIILHWQKERETVEMLVNNKKLPTIEESKLWPQRMFVHYKELWEAKWNNECPIRGRCIWFNDWNFKNVCLRLYWVYRESI
ncbi:hypothetical protein CTI12_AA516530 [Artemisia annua]|uniref:Uncharacterized protein n=1 Tax=Artemisia annua TaxID=35608 RepID=A0A2U1L998_ARTAN|nr:hypothetical protein CTI12_AA516530 [Artemisia annua]